MIFAKKSIVAIFENCKNYLTYWGALCVQFLEFFLHDVFFVINIAVLVGFDTILGLVCAWRAKRISSWRFGALFSKLAIYFVVLSASHHARTVFAGKNFGFLGDFLDSLLYSSICFRELLSILEKVILLGYLDINLRVLERFEVFRDFVAKVKNKEK